IVSRYRTLDRVPEREISADRDLRKGWRPLNLERRSQIAQRDLRCIHAPAKIAKISHMEIVNDARTDRPGLIQIEILLRPKKCSIGPKEISRERGESDAPACEIAEAKQMFLRKVLIHFPHSLIRIGRGRLQHLHTASRQVGKGNII